MQYKHPHYKIEFENAPILLQLVANDFEQISLEFGIEPIITRIIEKVEGDSGVHEQYRAIDFRDFYKGKSLYTLSQSLVIMNFINIKYQRVDKYKVCLHHNSGSGTHFHCQLPHLTEALRGPLWRK